MDQNVCKLFNSIFIFSSIISLIVTQTENRFNHFVKQGMDKYKHAVDAKTSKNTIKHALESMKYMEQALKLAPLIEKNDRSPYIYEYITLSHTIIGKSYLDEGNLQEAVKCLQEALKTNENTLKNEETTIRDVYIYEKLLDIALTTQSYPSADLFAQKIAEKGKLLPEPGQYVELLFHCKDAFIQAKNLTWIGKVYKTLLKVTKKHNFEKSFGLLIMIMVIISFKS